MTVDDLRDKYEKAVFFLLDRAKAEGERIQDMAGLVVGREDSPSLVFVGNQDQFNALVPSVMGQVPDLFGISDSIFPVIYCCLNSDGESASYLLKHYNIVKHLPN